MIIFGIYLRSVNFICPDNKHFDMFFSGSNFLPQSCDHLPVQDKPGASSCVSLGIQTLRKYKTGKN